MKSKNKINIAVFTETHKLLKELQWDLKVKSIDDAIVYLLENVE